MIKIDLISLINKDRDKCKSLYTETSIEVYLLSV